MSSKIDQLLENYLTSGKIWGNYVDVFVNPSKAEMREIQRGAYDVRFIVDIKKKNIYVWNGDNVLHAEAWRKIIKPHLKDSRDVYRDESLLPGEYYHTKGVTDVDSLSVSKHETLIKKLKQKWDFAEKWIPNIEKAVDDYAKSIHFKRDRFVS